MSTSVSDLTPFTFSVLISFIASPLATSLNLQCLKLVQILLYSPGLNLSLRSWLTIYFQSSHTRQITALHMVMALYLSLPSFVSTGLPRQKDDPLCSNHGWLKFTECSLSGWWLDLMNFNITHKMSFFHFSSRSELLNREICNVIYSWPREV